MRRRTFIAGLGSAAGLPLWAHAQQPTMPIIGYLHPGSFQGERRQVDAFRRAVNEAGYAEGQNLDIEYRWAEGHFDRTQTLFAGRSRLSWQEAAPHSWLKRPMQTSRSYFEFNPPRGVYVPRGAYVVTAKLPEKDGVFEYRVRSASEEHERAALEVS